MKLSTCLLASSAIYATQALDPACPDAHCGGNEVVTIAPTVDSSVNCPNLEAVTLDTFTYNGDVLIELLGPANMTNAADLLISAPHGGALKPDYVADRTWGSYTYADSNTKEISVLIQEKMLHNYCKVPFLIINHLHRSKMDANREVVEAAQGDPIAIEAWTNFHTFISDAQVMLKDHFGTSTLENPSYSRTGVHALMFDVHGYAGKDWAKPDGSPLIQWGYRMSDDSLESCPLDSRSTGTIGTLTHARWMDSSSYECLVRGEGSLATRVSDLIDADGGLTSNGLCGHGTPSNEFPSVKSLANDPNYCDEAPDDECHYYVGGYDVKVHERMNWQDENNLSGDHFNAIQAELPRCIRFGGNSVRENFADKMSIALMSFLRDLFGELPCSGLECNT